MSNYFFTLVIWMTLYVMYGVSLNLTVGYAGFLSLSQAAFAGIGGYTVAVLLLNNTLGFLPSLACAVAAGAVSSYGISLVAARLRHDHFVLASLGFQMFIVAVLLNWESVTNGTYGLANIPRPSLFGWEVRTPAELAALFAAFALLTIGVAARLGRSPFGRLLRAIREDEQAAASLGKNTARAKVAAFGISAALAALAGGLYASYITAIDPYSFDVWQSVFILSIVIIGGSGNIRGPVVGAALVLLVPEVLRWVEMPAAVADNLRQIIYGLLVIVLVRLRPQGIAGEYKLS